MYCEMKSARKLTHQSMSIELGMEGKYISKGCFKGKRIAVLTSGGDAQGMNSAVRAVVRMGIYCGCTVYFIREGYQGMVDGNENIEEATWASVSGIMNLGGTVIGSARCGDFRTRDGRLTAAKNLVDRGITNLVVIGGDGSLTGANLFRLEWPSLLTDLTNTGAISASAFAACLKLNIVGLVGSIDNDFCGTDMTIGADSALHRIIEACDSLTSTAHSHQRCFVLEVMGRHCGYLALVSALASEAEWVFIPESPPEDGWETKLCDKLQRNKETGQRVNIIIVAEGAQDAQCRAISAESVRQLVTDRVHIDTRVTVLGHVQRGGMPSAFDRILGIRMGAEAVLALIDAECNDNMDASVIAIDGNQIVRIPLIKCVDRTKAVAEAMAKKEFENAVTLRGKSFVNNFNTYIKLSKSHPPKTIEKIKRHRIAVLNVGAPACGTNSAVRSFTRMMISKGYDVIGVLEGFEGLVNDSYRELTWTNVRGWAALGGSVLGIRRDSAEKIGLQRVSDKIAKLNISGMLIIGGFEAYHSVLQMCANRANYPNFNIPMLCIPATISNNVPGTDFSLGADTSLNEITQIVDKIKQSAFGTKRRVFIVETQGGYCGYLATLSGLAGGADAAYIFEECFGIDDLREDVKHMKAKIGDNVQRGLILVNEKANKNYTPEFIFRLFGEEGSGVFDARINVPGHLQQGGNPSPFDRNMGVKMGSKASEWFDQQITDQEHALSNYCLLGIVKREYKFTPVLELKGMTDFKHRLPMDEWWLNLRPLMRIMAKHESLYTSETIMAGVEKTM